MTCLNCLAVKSLNMGMLIVDSIFVLIGLLLSFLLYLFIFIPNTNEFFMKEGISGTIIILNNSLIHTMMPF